MIASRRRFHVSIDGRRYEVNAEAPPEVSDTRIRDVVSAYMTAKWGTDEYQSAREALLAAVSDFSICAVN